MGKPAMCLIKSVTDAQADASEKVLPNDTHLSEINQTERRLVKAYVDVVGHYALGPPPAGDLEEAGSCAVPPELSAARLREAAECHEFVSTGEMIVETLARRLEG